MDRLLEEPPSQEVVDRILDFYFEVRDFLNISELVDENYEFILQKEKTENSGYGFSV